MPWTLYKYIIREMLKLLATSLAVLITVIAVALAIKPLSEGLLGPSALVKFVFYSAPTVLDIALPFAGAFASTLVFTRMVTDNEILACRANGMSYFAILTPVVLLGTMLTLGMFFLSSSVIPTFYRQAAFTLQQDLLRVVVAQLEEGKPFQQGDTVLYADAVVEQDIDPTAANLTSGVSGDVPATKLIMLRGVAVGQLDEDDRLRNDATAEQADLLLFQDGGKSWVEIRLANAMYYRSDPTQPWGSVQTATQRFDLPNPFENRLRFLGWNELRNLRNEPALLPDVNNARQRLIGEMAKTQAVREIARQLDPNRGRGLIDLYGYTDKQRYQIKAPIVSQHPGAVHMEGTDSQPIELAFRKSGVPQYQVKAKKGQLSITYDDDVLRMRLTLQQVTVTDSIRSRPPTEMNELPPISPLSWPTPIAEPLQQAGTYELLRLAHQPMYKDSEQVQYWVGIVKLRIEELGSKRKAMLNSRAAASVACTFVLLLGSVLSMQLRGRMPLEIFFWSFGLAAVGVIITRSAESGLSHPLRGQPMGVLIIWSGSLLLILAASLLFARLAKH